MTPSIVFEVQNRNIDYAKPVYIYRNLHETNGFKYSIKQNGKVVGRTNQIVLKDVKFKVNEKSRQRVVREKSKNVHAYVVGKIIPSIENFACLSGKVTYNPYINETFVYGALPMRTYVYCLLDKDGVNLIHEKSQR
jgi:hypothetical protein